MKLCYFFDGLNLEHETFEEKKYVVDIFIVSNESDQDWVLLMTIINFLDTTLRKIQCWSFYKTSTKQQFCEK